MDAERQEMIDKMTAVQNELVALVDGLDEAALSFRAADGGWTVLEMVAHLVDSEQAHRKFIQAVLAGKEIVSRPDFDLDRWNTSHVEKRAGQSAAELLAELGGQRDETLAVVRAIPAEGWLKDSQHPALGPVTVRQVVKIIGVHQKMHLKDMRAVLAAM